MDRSINQPAPRAEVWPVPFLMIRMPLTEQVSCARTIVCKRHATIVKNNILDNSLTGIRFSDVTEKSYFIFRVTKV